MFLPVDIIKIIKSKFFTCCTQFAVLVAATFPSHPTKAASSPSQSSSLSFACCCPCGGHWGRVRWGYCCSGQKAAQCWEGKGNQINSADFLSAWVRRDSWSWEQVAASGRSSLVSHTETVLSFHLTLHYWRWQMLIGTQILSFPSCWKRQYWLWIYVAHYLRTGPWTACWTAISIEYVTFSTWELINISRSPLWRCTTNFRIVWYPVPDMSADLYKIWIEM